MCKTICFGIACGAATLLSGAAFGQTAATSAYDAAPSYGPTVISTRGVMSPGHMSKEAELNGKVQEALDKYTAAKDDEAKQAARKQLQGALTELFDARQKEREDEIKQIEERVAKLRDTLKKRESMRQELIDHHLTTLIQDAEGLGWGSDSGAIGARAVIRTGPDGNAFYRIQPPGAVPTPSVAPVPVLPRPR
jgi:Spy/CpxP family protein refolding chaperone